MKETFRSIKSSAGRPSVSRSVIRSAVKSVRNDTHTVHRSAATGRFVDKTSSAGRSGGKGPTSTKKSASTRSGSSNRKRGR